jgi:hypothetical protein
MKRYAPYLFYLY